MIRFLFSLVCFSLSWIFLACPVYGQAGKTRQLKPQDYGQWSTIYDLGVSEKGSWCSYRLSYECGMDTLFVKSTANKKTYAFAKGADGRFNGDGWFGCLVDSRFEFVNLSNGKNERIDFADSFAFAGRYVFIHTNKNEIAGLTIRELATGKETQIADVDAYAVSPDLKSAAIAVTEPASGKVLLVRLDKSIVITEISRSPTETHLTLTWQKNSSSFAFASKETHSGKTVAVSLYRVAESKLFGFDIRKEPKWDKERLLSCNTTSSIAISNDGQRVFFTTVKEALEKPAAAAVEIWNAADKDLWPYRMRGWNNSGKEAVWWPDSGRLRMIGADGQITGSTTGDQKHMLTYDTAPYKPSWKQVPDRDIYITNLESGEMSLLLRQQFSEYGAMHPSPDGKHICYFKQGSWWVYDLSKKSHRSITDNHTVDFSSPYFQTPSVPVPHGLAAWTNDGKSVLVYDAFDIWKIGLDGGSARRLTSGREADIVFRISAVMFGGHSGSSVKFPEIPVVNLGKDLILEGNKTDGSLNGIYSLSANLDIRTLIAGKERHSNLMKSENGQYVFIKDDFDKPQEIVTLHAGTARSRSVFRSNPQHDLYGWGKSELLTFRNERGEKRTALLFYPFNYDPSRKYPMVVKVYEDLMYTMHRYVNPSLHNGDGYNTANFTSNGYFVLHPNIVYETGDRGLSAAKCIVDATEAAMEYAPIDKAKIGLIGHSFGGYETFFTITQTTIFAAAVAGAGMSDLTASYLSMGWNFSQPETWRYEYEQGGMGKPLYESPGSYRDNSGITYAQQVQTPLLSWTGANDPEVDPSQSMEFYMAMRRLRKEHVMLRYPNEGHSLLKPENEIDLTTKIMQWFDYYLKGKEKPAWSISN